MFTPDELILIRDLLTRNRKEKRTEAARAVLTAIVAKVDALLRANRKEAA